MEVQDQERQRSLVPIAQLVVRWHVLADPGDLLAVRSAGSLCPMTKIFVLGKVVARGGNAITLETQKMRAKKDHIHIWCIYGQVGRRVMTKKENYKRRGLRRRNYKTEVGRWELGSKELRRNGRLRSPRGFLAA